MLAAHVTPSVLVRRACLLNRYMVLPRDPRRSRVHVGIYLLYNCRAQEPLRPEDGRDQGVRVAGPGGTGGGEKVTPTGICAAGPAVCAATATIRPRLTPYPPNGGIYYYFTR